ncbi:MAG: WD40 repeat domain-containing protein [Bacteroidota bacterium]
MTIHVNKALTFSGHSAGVFALARAHEPHLFYSGSSDRFIALWNMELGTAEKFSAQLPSYIYALLYIKEKNYLAAGTFAGHIHLIDLNKKEEIKILEQHKGALFDLKYLPGQNMLAAAGGDGTLSFTSLDDLACKKIVRLCEEKVRNIALNADSTEAAISCGDGSIRIFGLGNLAEKGRIEAHKLSANIAAYHPNGKYLISGGRDAMMRVWDRMDNFRELSVIPAHNWALYDIVFSPDGSLFATASRDKTLKIWDSNSFGLLKVVNKEKNDSHRSSVNKLLWTSYHDLLVSASDDRSIMAWKIEKDETVRFSIN